MKNILQKAISEERIILTADMDFGHILSFTKAKDVSVIQFRMFDLTPKNVILKLQVIFDNFQPELTNHVLTTVQENKLRVKQLPI